MKSINRTSRLTAAGRLLAALAVTLSCLTAQAKSSHSHFTVEVQGQGKPVILIPGLMSDRRVWQDTAKELAKTHQLHLISIAGFAGTPAIKGELLPVVKTQLLAYINEQQLQQPAIIGHSLGAFMAYDLASSAPDRIGKIIAVDGLPYLAPVFTRNPNTSVSMTQPQATQMLSFYQTMDQTQLKGTLQQGVAIQAREAANQQAVIEMGAQSEPAAVGQAIYELLTTDLRDKVALIQKPVLQLGAGGALPDPAMRPAVEALYQQQLAKIPHAKLLFNWQSRHFIMLDEPQWFLTQIQQFLAE